MPHFKFKASPSRVKIPRHAVSTSLARCKMPVFFFCYRYAVDSAPHARRQPPSPPVIHGLQFVNHCLVQHVDCLLKGRSVAAVHLGHRHRLAVHEEDRDGMRQRQPPAAMHVAQGHAPPAGTGPGQGGRTSLLDGWIRCAVSMLIADLENILVLVKCYRSLILAVPARKARQPLWPKLEAAAVAKIVDRHNAVSIVLDGNPAYSVNRVDDSEEIALQTMSS